MIDYLMLAGLKTPPAPPSHREQRARPTESREDRAALILATLDEAEVPMTSTEIAMELDCAVKTTANTLNRLARDGVLRSWLESRNCRTCRLWARTGASA